MFLSFTITKPIPECSLTATIADSTLDTPSFVGNGYVAYAPLEGVSRSTQLELVIRPATISDSIIAYVGENKYGNGDFLALLIRNG